MSGFFICRTCGRRASPKGGKISCCGITESVAECQEENERHERAVARFGKKFQAAVFDPVITHWNEDDEEFNDYEGIPNAE